MIYYLMRTNIHDFSHDKEKKGDNIYNNDNYRDIDSDIIVIIITAELYVVYEKRDDKGTCRLERRADLLTPSENFSLVQKDEAVDANRRSTN